MSSHIGQRIGNYHVVRQLGEGGTGSWFEAIHQHSKERAAVVVVRRELLQDEAIGTRLFHDVCGTQLLKSRSIVSVYEVGLLPDGAAYMAMEYLHGTTLAHHLRQPGASLSGTAVLCWAYQIASLLMAAHRKGLVHGDLRPDNVMLLPDASAPSGSRVKLLNFGLPRLIDINGISEVLSRSGMAYLAPEQLRHAEATALSDVYSLGALLFHLLSGRPPVAAAGQEPLALRQLDASIPEELEELVQRTLHTVPAERPAMEQVAARLRYLLLEHGEHLEPEPAPGPIAAPAPPRPARLWRRMPRAGAGAAAMSFLAGIFVTLLWVQRRGPAEPAPPPVCPPQGVNAPPQPAAEPSTFRSVGSALDEERPQLTARAEKAEDEPAEGGRAALRPPRVGPPIPPLRLFEPGGRRSRSRRTAAVKSAKPVKEPQATAAPSAPPPPDPE